MSIHTRICQFTDLGIPHEELCSYLAWNGYWKDENAKERYKYVLSPSAYVVTPSQREALEHLAVATYAAVTALNERLCDIRSMKSPGSHEDGLLFALANSASRGLFRPSDGEHRIPPVIKVDLIQDTHGQFRIAEVDTYNPRGLGFIALLEDSIAGLKAPRFPGMQAVVDMMKASSRDWHVLISEFERYYETPFRIFAQSAARWGLPVQLVREESIAQRRDSIPQEASLIVIPESLSERAVREDLLARYRTGSMTTFFPPVAYLGSKAFLPFLREQSGMNEFIPPTALIRKKARANEKCINTDALLVLKATVSSGLKKVLFSDLDEHFSAALDEARSLRNPSWILQEQVPQMPHPIVVFDKNGKRVTEEYFLRVTAYVSREGVVDAEVTGRPDRKVHGAPDCIMVPAILG